MDINKMNKVSFMIAAAGIAADILMNAMHYSPADANSSYLSQGMQRTAVQQSFYPEQSKIEEGYPFPEKFILAAAPVEKYYGSFVKKAHYGKFSGERSAETAAETPAEQKDCSRDSIDNKIPSESTARVIESFKEIAPLFAENGTLIRDISSGLRIAVAENGALERWKNASGLFYRNYNLMVISAGRLRCDKAYVPVISHELGHAQTLREYSDKRGEFTASVFEIALPVVIHKKDPKALPIKASMAYLGDFNFDEEHDRGQIAAFLALLNRKGDALKVVEDISNPFYLDRYFNASDAIYKSLKNGQTKEFVDLYCSASKKVFDRYAPDSSKEIMRNLYAFDMATKKPISCSFVLKAEKPNAAKMLTKPQKKQRLFARNRLRK